MKDGAKFVLKLILLLLVGLGFWGTLSAQQVGDTKKLQEDISTLKDEIKTLEETQKQILGQLAEMKKLLVAQHAGFPTLQLPTTEDIQSDPSEGASSASIAIIEYTDFQCPFCGIFVHQTYTQILADYVDTGRVRFIYRDLPSAMHPFAMSAARAARCAEEQGKFWQMHDSLFADQNALAYNSLVDRGPKLGLDVVKYNQCISSNKYADAIQNNIKQAKKIGILGTPTFFLGIIEADKHTVKVEKALQGAQPYEAFKSNIDVLLAQKGQQTAITAPPKKP